MAPKCRRPSRLHGGGERGAHRSFHPIHQPGPSPIPTPSPWHQDTVHLLVPGRYAPPHVPEGCPPQPLRSWRLPPPQSSALFSPCNHFPCWVLTASSLTVLSPDFGFSRAGNTCSLSFFFMFLIFVNRSTYAHARNSYLR